jgi:O-acetyl-ADP-ribose deacetylase
VRVNEAKVGSGSIVLVQGDITKERADAIVTAANAELRGGGGVDGAVHRAAGPKLLAACRKIGGCKTGSAVVTPSFDLEARGVKHVIHAVGPIWSGGTHNEDAQLESAYRTSLEVAEEAGCTSIAFPSISTGVYGFPIERAAPIAITAARDFLGDKTTFSRAGIMRVVFVLFDQKTHAAFEKALA